MAMPETASPPPRKRGRPRTFDQAEVLDKSLQVFWQRGYGNVTTRDLERLVGISQSSLYNTFGSKEGLFRQALNRYMELASIKLLPILEGQNPGPEDLVAFVDAVVDWVGDPEHPGCLVMRFGIESPAGHNLATLCRDRVHTLIRTTVRSFTPGEVEATHRTNLVQASILSICSMAGSGVSRDNLYPGAEAISQQIRSWATAPD